MKARMRSEDQLAKLDPRRELKDYLASAVIEVRDLVGWWGVSLSQVYLSFHTNFS